MSEGRYSFDQAQNEAMNIKAEALKLKMERKEVGEPSRDDYAKASQSLQKAREIQENADSEKLAEVRRGLSGEQELEKSEENYQENTQRHRVEVDDSRRGSESTGRDNQITIGVGEDHTPFRDLKKVESEHTGLYEIKDKPGFVVRKEKFVLDGITNDGLITKKTTEQLALARAMFSRLREKYGVPVLNFNYIIGEDPDKKGTPKLYTFEEKVKGTSLDKIESFRGDSVEKIDKAYFGILSQLADSFESGDHFWLDAEQSQFILGKRDGEMEEQPYVADPEPRVAHFKNLKNPEYFLLERVYDLLHDIEDIESRAHGTKLEKSREIIKKVFAKIPMPGAEEKYFGEDVLPAYSDIAKRLE